VNYYGWEDDDCHFKFGAYAFILFYFIFELWCSISIPTRDSLSGNSWARALEPGWPSSLWESPTK
jgi:hypothetical protein